MLQKKGIFSTLADYREIVIAIILFLVFDLGVLVMNMIISNQIHQDAIGINLAGRQRMLSQRTVKTLLQINEAHRQGASADVARTELRLTFDLFDSTLQGFSTGGMVTGGDGEPTLLAAADTPAARAIVQQAIAVWTPYKEKLAPLLTAYAAITPERLFGAIVYASDNNLRLLALMNTLTTELEQSASNRATMLRRVQAAAIVLALINFAVILTHFLRKLAERDRAISRYSRELEKRVAQGYSGEENSKTPRAQSAGRVHDKNTSIDENELSRRRRAVVRGLNGHLKREQLLQAMCIWEDRFSHGSTFALFEFVHQVLHIPGVTVGRNHLHASLLQNMMLTLEQLGPDPWREIQQFRMARN